MARLYDIVREQADALEGRLDRVQSFVDFFLILSNNANIVDVNKITNPIR